MLSSQDPLVHRDKCVQLIASAVGVPGFPGPVSKLRPGGQSLGGLGSQDPLMHRQQRGQLIASHGRISRIADVVGEVVAVNQGVRVLGP